MKVFLRPVTLADGKYIVKWRKDPDVLSHCMSKAPVTLESNAKFFKANIETGRYKQFMVERIEEEFGLCTYTIATVYLKDMDYENKKCELCVFTSNNDEWTAESQSIAIKMLVEKAFKEYEMHKIYSYVFAKFPEEVELLSKAGFKQEVVLKDEASSGKDQFEDVIRMCIYSNNKK